MQDGDFVYRMWGLFCRIMITLTIGSVSVSCSQTKMLPLQFHNIVIQYPESWSVEDSNEGLLLQPGLEGVDAGVMILSNPIEYMEENLQHSLDKFLSSDLIPNLKEILTTTPVQEFDFNGYQAVQGQIVADVARSEGATYALQYDLILVQHENERALIIVHRRGGIETVREDIAKDVESILNSFRFREN